MANDLYDVDALAWADRQAALLRRLAAGERLDGDVDWPHVIEEIQDVGLSELRACQSLLVQAITHLLKLQAWPDSHAAAHWRGETANFLAGARRAFSPSMRQRLDLADLYADAHYAVRSTSDASGDPRMLPEACRFVLDDLIAARPDVEGLLVRLETSE